MQEITESQLRCIQAFLSGRMDLNHGGRMQVYHKFFREEIKSTKDLTISEASQLIEKIKSKPDALEDEIAETLGWQRLFDK